VKTVGVLGGLGPQATMDFEARFHRAAQRLIPQRLNGGYPPLVVYYCRHPPVIAGDDGRALPPIRPDPRLFDAARKLGTLADLLVITANGVHRFQPEIEQSAGRPVVSMVEATLREVRRRGWRRVGVVGLGEPAVYLSPLRETGVHCETIDPPLQAAMDDAIFRVMEGREGPEMAATARRSVQVLRDRGVDGVILGCTEIPLLLGAAADGESDLLNPAELLAEAAVRAAIR
jgi:aspartate racemase